MSVITKVPEPNLWEEICKEFRNRGRSEEDGEDDKESVATEYSDFDPGRHHPAFYGRMHALVPADDDEVEELDQGVGHPACTGFAFTEKPPKPPTPPGPPPPDRNMCSPRQYLEYYVFPYLLPALEGMFKQAEAEKCFERKRTKFNALDFITEFLFRVNPHHSGREGTILWDIPFVKEWLKDHPRPPLPKSLLWTEEEAALIVQSYYRGYRVRRNSEIQELRKWQQEWREINGNITHRVSHFWDKKMPEADEGGSDQNASAVIANQDSSSPVPESTAPTSVPEPEPTPPAPISDTPIGKEEPGLLQESETSRPEVQE